VPGKAMAWVWQGQAMPTQAPQAVKEARREMTNRPSMDWFKGAFTGKPHIFHGKIH